MAEATTNKPDPASGLTAEQEIAALNQIIAEQREAQGIAEPQEAFAKLKLATLAPVTPERQAQIDAELAAMEQAERDRARQRRLREFLDSVGELHKVCRLQNFECKSQEQRKALDALKEYGDTLPERLESAEGLILYGPVGTGKDHLAVSLGGIAVERFDRSVRLVNAQEWFGDIRDAMDSKRDERLLIGELARPDVLIVSDPVPPTGPLTQHMATMLYRLVEKRDCRGKVTWMTLNVKDDADADKQLGEPTWDRLCDRAWKIHCRWASHRKPSRTVNC